MLVAEHVVGLLPMASDEIGAGLWARVVGVSATGPSVATRLRSLATTGGIATLSVPVIRSTRDAAVHPVGSQQYAQCANASVAIATFIDNIRAETIS
jgi:hypothetical protein